MSDRTISLVFSLSSYWRIGSGKGSDAVADALVLRDGNGLPIIPGKTVKGLLRDAMELSTLSGTLSTARIEQLFGSALPGHAEAVSGDDQERNLEANRYSTSEGRLWFGTARLPQAWSAWARSDTEKQDILNALFTFQSSTSIDKDGVAMDRSLRVAEVAVPMELRAEVRGPSDDVEWVKDLKTCLPLLRYLGSRRSRGFGRVDVRMEDAK